MKQEVKRNYLEINSLQDLKESKLPSEDYSLDLLDPINFQLNKFVYKNIGKKHNWVDRLIWSEQQWIDYILSKKVKTYVFKHKDDLAGFFELIFHHEKKEVEIAYFGILEEYQNKKLGSYLLSKAIKKSFKENINRVWVHTCSLDHKNALNNYIDKETLYKTIIEIGNREDYKFISTKTIKGGVLKVFEFIPIDKRKGFIIQTFDGDRISKISFLLNY